MAFEEIKNIGSAWLIIEESFQNQTKNLISMIKPKMEKEYISQMYVEKCGSISEKISYKKGHKGPFKAIVFSDCITCGDEPTYTAHRCYELSINGCVLTYKFETRLRKNKGEFILKDGIPLTKEITDTITINNTGVGQGS